MKRAAVIGDPIAQSRSPPLHRRWLEVVGLRNNPDTDYFSLRVPQSHAIALISALTHTDFLGVNVTAPLKSIAAMLAHEASDDVRALGVANLLLFRDGLIHAENTDIQALRLLLPASQITGQRALIWGAGDTARVAVAHLQACGAAQITIANRTPQRAVDLAGRYGALPCPLFDVPRAALDTDVIVNTLNPWPVDLPVPLLHPGQLVIDYGYVTGGTVFTRHAHAYGAQVIDGFDLLVEQARPSFAALFDHPAPDDSGAADWLRGLA